MSRSFHFDVQSPCRTSASLVLRVSDAPLVQSGLPSAVSDKLPICGVIGNLPAPLAGHGIRTTRVTLTRFSVPNVERTVMWSNLLKHALDAWLARPAMHYPLYCWCLATTARWDAKPPPNRAVVLLRRLAPDQVRESQNSRIMEKCLAAGAAAIIGRWCPETALLNIRIHYALGM